MADLRKDLGEMRDVELVDPNLRHELLGYLNDSVTLGNEAPNAPPEHLRLSLIIHFLFDDTPLSDDAQGCVGHFLYTNSEAHAVTRVTDALRMLPETFGKDVGRPRFVADLAWIEAVVAAKDALTVLGSHSAV